MKWDWILWHDAGETHISARSTFHFFWHCSDCWLHWIIVIYLKIWFVPFYYCFSGLTDAGIRMEVAFRGRRPPPDACPQDHSQDLIYPRAPARIWLSAISASTVLNNRQHSGSTVPVQTSLIVLEDALATNAAWDNFGWFKVSILNQSSLDQF